MTAAELSRQIARMICGGWLVLAAFPVCAANRAAFAPGFFWILPSVSRAMHLLKDRGYIDVQADGAITLTDEGRAIAENIYDRHNVLAQALRSIGVDEQTAVDDACRVEHYISEATFQAIKAHLEKKQ